MYLLLLKVFLFNAIFAVEGFVLAMLLRELYRARAAESLWKDFVPTTDEEIPVEAAPIEVPEEPEWSREPAPEPMPEPMPEPPNEPQHHYNADEFDESLLPKGFKVESVLENMLDSGYPVDDSERIPDLMPSASETDSFGGSDTAFEEEESHDFFDEDFSFESSPLSSIDLTEEKEADETSNISQRNSGVSSLAVELLGTDFDFEAILQTPPTAEEPLDTPLEPLEVAEITELEDDAYRTESGFLPDGVAVRNSTSDQWIESAYPPGMIDEQLVEQDRSTDLVFTTDSPPMLSKRRRTGKKRPA